MKKKLKTKSKAKPIKIAIVGAGLVGRILALNLIKQGYQITLFDEDTSEGNKAAAMTAAGMLAPYSELETAESIIAELGKRSIELWPRLLKQIGVEDAFQFKGSLILSHPQDFAELQQFISSIRHKIAVKGEITTLDSTAISKLEPELSNHQQGFYIQNEGQIDTQQFMQASTDYLYHHPQVTWLTELKISKISPGGGVYDKNNQQYEFDWVFDTRGLGAKKQLKNLRGVRGEVFWLDAPDVKITRPVRLQHPRYKIYIVPRKNNRYVVGATEIESEDKSPMSVRSSLELLSAVYTVHPAFGEARIIKMMTNCRPALVDNLPIIRKNKKCITINGLYRHGYLLAPALVVDAIREITNE